MGKKNYTTEEQKTDNIQGNEVLADVSEPLLWEDILYDFYVEHDKQISNGEYAGKMILVFRDWLEKNYQVPKRIKSGDKRTKPLAENREADEAKNGVVETYYDNGQLMERATYKDDELEGLYEVWYENGQPELRGYYKDGKTDGLYEAWYENGQPELRGYYKDGKLEGLREIWYGSGQLKSKANYKDGKPDGLYNEWDENGNLVESTMYKDGVKQ